MTDNNKSEPGSLQNSWILVNHIEEAEEATALDRNEEEIVQETEKIEEIKENIESDVESDSISVISDTNVNDSNTEDENATIKDGIVDKNAPKWTFVEDNLINEAPTQKFYLNCMQEPVQELSEQELGSLHSDLEMESDGISIISDTDDYLDPGNVLEELPPIEKQRFEWWDLKKYCGNFLVMSTVSLAVLSIFLSPYFSNTTINEDDIVMYEKDLKSTELSNNYDPIVYCQEKHKKDGIYREVNVKKCKRCFNKVGKNKDKKNKNKKNNGTLDEKQLKIKEEYLKQKEEFLIKKEHELHRVEIKLKNMQQNEKNDEKIEHFDSNKKIMDNNKKHYKLKDHYKKFKKEEPVKTHKEKIKSYKEENHKVNRGIKNIKVGNPDNVYIKENKSMPGFWYTNIGQNRLNIRKNERQGEWLFDRAGLRKKQRKNYKFKENKLSVAEKVKKFMKNYF
ncbi:unnamed protein product [Brassicogethes aeneus]|uniref:Uncharacterized protein n=1 Tax=Brassicogethes aeneus TaxID=1431903 RepID=A0A9P0FLV9_BRAAE|nr:unnamed protein product [Brassicogethes aeneus]